MVCAVVPSIAKSPPFAGVTLAGRVKAATDLDLRLGIPVALA